MAGFLRRMVRWLGGKPEEISPSDKEGKMVRQRLAGLASEFEALRQAALRWPRALPRELARQVAIACEADEKTQQFLRKSGALARRLRRQIWSRRLFRRWY